MERGGKGNDEIATLSLSLLCHLSFLLFARRQSFSDEMKMEQHRDEEEEREEEQVCGGIVYIRIYYIFFSSGVVEGAMAGRKKNFLLLLLQSIFSFYFSHAFRPLFLNQRSLFASPLFFKKKYVMMTFLRSLLFVYTLSSSYLQQRGRAGVRCLSPSSQSNIYSAHTYSTFFPFLSHSSSSFFLSLSISPPPPFALCSSKNICERKREREREREREKSPEIKKAQPR